MSNCTIYVGIDVHLDSFSICAFSQQQNRVLEYVRTEADYRKIVCFIDRLRLVYKADDFLCGYEAGCLGFSLLYDLISADIKCVVIAPSSIPIPRCGLDIKTDYRDSIRLARALADGAVSVVPVPEQGDLKVRDFIRMRKHHVCQLSKIKQAILSFCAAHGISFQESAYWTDEHLAFLERCDNECLNYYLQAFHFFMVQIQTFDKKIEEFARDSVFRYRIRNLTCFYGIRELTALSIITEIGDFSRFSSPKGFCAFIGLVPSESSSNKNQTKYCITKHGNERVRTLIVEAAQCIARSTVPPSQSVPDKSKNLLSRQAGSDPRLIEYADFALARLRSRFYHLAKQRGKNYNIAVIAIARELACFIWGAMTQNWNCF